MEEEAALSFPPVPWKSDEESELEVFFLLSRFAFSPINLSGGVIVNNSALEASQKTTHQRICFALVWQLLCIGWCPTELSVSGEHNNFGWKNYGEKNLRMGSSEKNVLNPAYDPEET